MKNLYTFEEFVNEAGSIVYSTIGPRIERIVISHIDKDQVESIIDRINKISTKSTIQFYEKTGKIVGSVEASKIRTIKSELGKTHPKVKVERKPLAIPK